MFDKIPSLKDFIIYVIPGMISCYFGLNIINQINLFDKPFTSESISKNSVLTIIGVIFSFLIGFIISQLQIITYNFILNRTNTRIRTIQGTSLSIELKEKIADQLIKTFNLNVARDRILADIQILYLCINYLKIYSTEESISSINRSGNLSTFASALPIPVMLGSWNLLLELRLSTIQMIVILVTFFIFLIAFVTKIILNFRKEWVNNVYRQFLILSLKQESHQER